MNTAPNVSAWYPLGRYIEDHDYLGDLGKKQGRDFDLDENNARFCVTPEFPNGTWAYFVAHRHRWQPGVPIQHWPQLRRNSEWRKYCCHYRSGDHVFYGKLASSAASRQTTRDATVSLVWKAKTATS